jgi:undecaprenyl-diphosphatase
MRHALALGLLHGPTELLPVSSAGHTTLVPWLAGWPYAQLDGESRKSFEVALHAGAAAALLLRPPVGGTWMRRRVSSQCAAAEAGGEACVGTDMDTGNPGIAALAAAVAPPSAVGYALHARIERLGTPSTIAAGLLAGSLAMVAAEVSARRGGAVRAACDARALDGLAVGVAQAVALVPGMSRSGAAFAAARARGFAAREADRLSWQAGLPTIGGAALLQCSKLARRGAPREMGLPLAVGTASAFASTLLARELIGPERRARAVLPASLYRGALAALAIVRARRDAGPSPPNSNLKK